MYQLTRLSGINIELDTGNKLQKLKIQKQPPKVFYKKGVLKNLAKLTGKHLCQSLFFNKVVGLRPEFCEKFKNTFFTEHFWTTASEKSPSGGSLKSLNIFVYLLNT